MGYQLVEEFCRYVCPFWRNTGTWQTDDSIDRAICVYSVAQWKRHVLCAVCTKLCYWLVTPVASCDRNDCTWPLDMNSLQWCSAVGLIVYLTLSGLLMTTLSKGCSLQASSVAIACWCLSSSNTMPCICFWRRVRMFDLQDQESSFRYSTTIFSDTLTTHRCYCYTY